MCDKSVLRGYNRNCCKLYIAIFRTYVWHYISILRTQNIRVAQWHIVIAVSVSEMAMHVLCNSICHSFTVIVANCHYCIFIAVGVKYRVWLWLIGLMIVS